MNNGAKKSFYVFLSALLGLLLFILLQRSLFLLAFLLGVDVLSAAFMKLDYASFIVAMFLGMWYGIWVGLYWFNIVYEEQSAPGMFRSIWGSFGRSKARMLSDEGKSWNLEDLMKAKTSEYESETLEPTLRVFESNTVAFSAPLHAREIHSRQAEVAEVKTVSKPKRTVKRTTKKASKKSES